MTDTNNTDATEIERRKIVVAAVEGTLTTPGAELSMKAIGDAIEAAFPGFAFDEALDGGPVADALRDLALPSDPIAQELIEKAFPIAGAPYTETHPHGQPEYLRSEVARLDIAVSDARNALQAATADRQAARANSAASIQALMTRLPRVTAESNVRAFLADQLAERAAAGKTGRGDQAAVAPTPGNSVLDRSLARFGGADNAVRSQLRVGHRRGAFPSHMRGGRILPKV